ncbi:MAG: RDD family protein [Bacteroidota bacterium]
MHNKKNLILWASIFGLLLILLSLQTIYFYLSFFLKEEYFSFAFLVLPTSRSIANIGLLSWGIIGLNRLQHTGREDQSVRVMRLLVTVMLIAVPINLISLILNEGFFVNITIVQALSIAGYYIGTIGLFYCLWQLYQSLPKAKRLEITLLNDDKVSVSRWKRFLNWTIDSFVRYQMAITFAQLLAYVFEMDFVGVTVWLWNILFVLLSVVMYSVCESLYGQSLGKAITNTRVAYNPSIKSTTTASIGRSLARLVPFEALSIFKDNRIMWHDEWSKTAVVDYDLLFTEGEAEATSLGQDDLLDDVSFPPPLESL